MKVFLLLFFLLPLKLLAQAFPVDALSGKIYYAEEVLVKDGPTVDLYNRAKTWFAAAGKNENTLAVDDLANGLIIGSNYRLLLVPDGQKAQTYRLWYTVKLELEDDRYWYSFTDFQLQQEQLPKATGGMAPSDKIPLEPLVLAKYEAAQKEEKRMFEKSIAQAAQESIAALIKDLKASML